MAGPCDGIRVLDFTTVLYAVFLGLATWGFFEWRASMRATAAGAASTA